MSPRVKHTSPDATLTSIKLTDEDRTAINWIKLARKRRWDDRDRLNDILVDGLWYLLQRVEQKTRDEIQAMMPSPPPATEASKKVTEMPKPKKAR
jgi:hypothetical protein